MKTAKKRVYSIVVDSTLTFQEHDCYTEAISRILRTLSAVSPECFVSLLLDHGKSVFRHVTLKPGSELDSLIQKSCDGYFGESGHLSIATDMTHTEMMFRIALDDVAGLSDRHFIPVIIALTNGRRQIGRDKRKTLVEYSRRNIPLIVYRLTGDSRELCCDDDGLKWACNQTPRGQFLKHSSEEVLLEMFSNLLKPNSEVDPISRVLSHEDQNVKLIEYELPRFNMYQMDAIIEARQRDGFKTEPKKYGPTRRYRPQDDETSAHIEWSPRVTVDYLIKVDLAARKFKAQFRLRGPHALLKHLETNPELVQFVHDSIEIDLVVTSLVGPNSEATTRLFLNKLTGAECSRFIKVTYVDALCSAGAESEAETLFPRNQEWIIPNKMFRVTTPHYDVDRAIARIQENRKLLLVPPSRLSTVGLFRDSKPVLSHVLRQPESILSEESYQEATLTLANLWKRRGYFQLPSDETISLDFVTIPEANDLPCTRIIVVGGSGLGLTAQIFTEDALKRHLDQIEQQLREDEQVISRLQLFSQLSSVKELLPFSRRSMKLSLPAFVSLSSSESFSAFSNAVDDVFTVKIAEDDCHARYVSKDIVVVLAPIDDGFGLHEIRRMDLLPSPSIILSPGSLQPPPGQPLVDGDDVSYMVQLVTLLRSGFARSAAVTVHSKALPLVAKDDISLISEGCDLMHVDIDFTKLATMDIGTDDFIEHFASLIMEKSDLVALDVDQGFFRSSEGFLQMSLGSETDMKRVSLAPQSVEGLKTVLAHCKTMSLSGAADKVLLRLGLLIPFGTLAASTFGEFRTLSMLEKRINHLISTTILKYARRISSATPEVAIRLVKETLASVPDCVRFDVELSPFVSSSTVEHEDEKLELFVKELAAQTDFPLRIVSGNGPLPVTSPATGSKRKALLGSKKKIFPGLSMPSGNGSQSLGHNVLTEGVTMCHSDEDGWCLLLVGPLSIHIEVWSFSDPAGTACSAKVSACILMVQRRTNQFILLSDLQDTRVASSLLVPASDSDYPFFACPAQKHLEISLGRWVSRQRMIQALGASPIFFIRNRERWFVYRAVSNNIAYFSCLSSWKSNSHGEVVSTNPAADEEDGDSNTLDVEVYAVEPLTQSAIDHLLKLLHELVVELAVEALSASLRQQMQGLGGRTLIMSESEWDVDLLISHEGLSSKHTLELQIAAPNIVRHLLNALPSHLFVVLGEESLRIARTTAVPSLAAAGRVHPFTVVALVEQVLLIACFSERSSLPSSSPTFGLATNSATPRILSVDIWIPTRKGNGSRAFQAFTRSFEAAVRIAERSALFEQRLLAEDESISNFASLLGAARQACGSQVMRVNELVQRPESPGGPEENTVWQMPAWSTLYVLHDIERRAKKELHFDKAFSFKVSLKRNAQQPQHSAWWSLLHEDDERRVLSADDEGNIPGDEDPSVALGSSMDTFSTQQQQLRKRIPLVLEGLAFVVANKPFWLRQKSSLMSPAVHKAVTPTTSTDIESSVADPKAKLLHLPTSPLSLNSKKLQQAPQAGVSLSASTDVVRVDDRSTTSGTTSPTSEAWRPPWRVTSPQPPVPDVEEKLKILIVIVTRSQLESVCFALDEGEMHALASITEISLKWLIGRLQAFSHPIVRHLAALGKRPIFSPPVPVHRRSSSVASVTSISTLTSMSPRASGGFKRLPDADPTQEIARWTQDRRGPGNARTSVDVNRIYSTCRHVMSFRSPALISFPDNFIMSSDDIIKQSSSVLEDDLKMSLISETTGASMFFSILGGTHLLMARLGAAGGGVGVDVVVRELGKHQGGLGLGLALSGVHDTVPLVRAKLYDMYVEKMIKCVCQDMNAALAPLAFEFGRNIRSNNWGATKGITSSQIACEVRNILEHEFEEWTRALIERNTSLNSPFAISNFALGNVLVHVDNRFHCLLQVTRVVASPVSSRVTLVYAELCVLAEDRSDLDRDLEMATQWAKHKVEVCAADVRWKSFWRTVKQSSARGEVYWLVIEEDMVGEEARVSLTMIDPRYDDILACIEQGVSWLNPLQRMLSQSPGWLFSTVRHRSTSATAGLLISRDDCCDRFAVYAGAEDSASTIFDLLSHYESDIRSFPPELQNMLSSILRMLGAIFIDACVARVGTAFNVVGQESQFAVDQPDSDTENSGGTMVGDETETLE